MREKQELRRARVEKSNKKWEEEREERRTARDRQQEILVRWFAS
jgi:hypothetical protein